MAQRILFVCLGNICRSPTAEAVVRAKAQGFGMDLQIDSAGTAGWHSGKPPYGPMQTAARARGYEMSNLRARQVSSADATAFDIIIAMDAENQSDLAALGLTAQLFTDFAPESGTDHVPDPYFTRDFDGALQLIELCADGLLSHLSSRAIDLRR